jgi:mono/diheme cytochrome c family protein
MSRSTLWSTVVVVPALVLLAGFLPPSAHAQRPEAAKGAAKPEATADDKAARGQYIVEDVAMCGRCHSPVDVHGNRDRTHWLMGGAVGIAPTVATEGWAIMAPRIAGAPPGTEAQFVQLMTTGVSRTGFRMRQPMPQFRMTQGDAEAVLAYLKSLGSHTPMATN